MKKEDLDQYDLIHEEHFLNNITLLCIIISAMYTVSYLLLDLKIAGFLNMFIMPIYSITFFLIRSKVFKIARFWTVSVYIIQIFILSFVFFPKDAGYHFYFIVIPLITLFIKRNQFSLLKLVFNAIPMILFFYCEIFLNNLSPIYPLNETLMRALYLSSIATVISGMFIVIYFFLKEKENLILEINTAKNYAESLFNFSPSAIYTLGLNEQIVDFNIKAELLSEYSLRELKGKKIDFIRDNILKTKSGKLKTIELYSSDLFDKNQKQIGSIICFIDITERVELEEFKIGIERVIRHDLKTPLNTILGFPELLLADESLSEENKNYLQIIKNSGQYMLNLINASQELYRIEHDSFVYRQEKVDISQILKQISLNLKDLAIRKKCRIITYYNNELTNTHTKVVIGTEKTLFYMIFTNLIKNALEASPDNTEVTIRINDRDIFSISVHNLGIIPDEIRSNFFNKYVTWGKKKGNGLGTYSAKIMSEAIRADLRFNSSIEAGTMLIFSLRN